MLKEGYKLKFGIGLFAIFTSLICFIGVPLGSSNFNNCLDLLVLIFGIFLVTMSLSEEEEGAKE